MSSSPRILFFTATSSPIGGVETWLDRCCAHLSAAGMQPVVGLARGLKYNRPERFREFHPDLDCVEVDGRGLDREGRIRALMRTIRRVGPDIVLPMSLVETHEAVLRCRQRGDDVRLVVHAQGNLPRMLADLAHYEPVIDHVVCPGGLTERILTAWGGFDTVRVTHVPNGADLPTTPRLDRACDAPLRLGYVGRFTRNDKRVLDLVGLYEQLVALGLPFELKIVGEGPAGAELRAALEGKPQVSILGAMSHEELYRDVFPQLDVLVLCSDSEAFGIVIAEAMMNGVVPVTSTYLGYHSERLVVDEQTGLSFPVGEMHAAAAQIQRLAADRSLLAELSCEGQQHVRQNYTWPRSLREWERVLREVASAPPRTVQAADLPSAKIASGRLDTTILPVAVTDWLRRCRRAVLGSAVPPGGEEWPMFALTHAAETLAEVAETARRLECQAAGQPTSGRVMTNLAS